MMGTWRPPKSTSSAESQGNREDTERSSPTASLPECSRFPVGLPGSSCPLRGLSYRFITVARASDGSQDIMLGPHVHLHWRFPAGGNRSASETSPWRQQDSVSVSRVEAKRKSTPSDVSLHKSALCLVSHEEKGNPETLSQAKRQAGGMEVSGE